MIGFFPTVYPDELLYSLCARYSDRVQYPNSLAVNVELFSSYQRLGNVGLPVRLNHFFSALPTGQPYSLEDFICNNTLFPFYAPFFPPERVSRLLKIMKGSSDSVNQSLAGTFNSSVKTPHWLRFCSMCMKEHDQNYRERYWYRLHQVPGVEVCPSHLIFLEHSNIPSHNQGNPPKYVSAEYLSSFAKPVPLDSSDYTHQTLLRITRDVKWLLEQRNLVVTASSLHNCYMNILAERGFTRDRGVNLGKLHKEFQTFYPSRLLSLLQCKLNEQKTSDWLSRLLPYLNRGKSSHPLRHLLLIQFLGYTAESFFNRCKLKEPFKPVLPKNPFGEGPWFCLNPTCDYFRKRSIKDCHITYSHRHKVYYGTFRCACGFTFIRRLPLTSNEDQFRVGKVKTHGPIWESALKELWENPDFTLKDIALELGFNHKAIKYHALRLGLTFPRPGPGLPSTQVSPRHQERLKKAQNAERIKLKTYRSKWLTNLKRNNGATRSALKQNLIYAHSWLSKNDREWLEAHMPPPHRNNGAASLFDWKGRDIQLAGEVRLISLQLINAEGRPIRVTKRALFRDKRQHKWLYNQKVASKLPLTIEALCEVVETRVQFSLRRIRWAVDCFTRENIVPSLTKLAERAGVINSKSLPEVNAELEAAILSLQRLDNTNLVKVV